MIISLFFVFLSQACESPEFKSAKVYLQLGQLDDAEEQLLKSMSNEADAENALVPFYLANDIYAPQGRFQEMAQMFDEAERRLTIKDQNIDGEPLIDRIMQAREIAWSRIYNRATQTWQTAGSAEGEDNDRCHAGMLAGDILGCGAWG